MISNLLNDFSNSKKENFINYIKSQIEKSDFSLFTYIYIATSLIVIELYIYKIIPKRFNLNSLIFLYMSGFFTFELIKKFKEKHYGKALWYFFVIIISSSIVLYNLKPSFFN